MKTVWKHKKILFILAGVVALALTAVLLWPALHLARARGLEAAGRFDEAALVYARSGRKDAEALIAACNRHKAESKLAHGDFEGACADFRALGDEEAALDALEAMARFLADQGSFDQALTILSGLPRDETQAMAGIYYRQAVALQEQARYEQAAQILEDLGDWGEAAQRLTQVRYAWALALEEAGDSAKARELLALVAGYEDADAHKQAVDYAYAGQAVEAGRVWEGFQILWSLGEYESARIRARTLAVADLSRAVTLDAGKGHLARVMADGSAQVTGSGDYGQDKTESWDEIVSVAVGDAHTLGLRLDGTAVAAGSDAQGQCQVSAWKNVKQIAAGGYVSVGLTRDGRVLVTPSPMTGLAEAAAWENVVDIAAGYDYILGLTSDGTLLACGANDYHQITFPEGLRPTRIFAREFLTALVDARGSVALCGAEAGMTEEVALWKNVGQLALAMGQITALTREGRVLTAGRTDLNQNQIDAPGAVAVATNGHYVLALMPDGTLRVSGGKTLDWSNIRVWQ